MSEEKKMEDFELDDEALEAAAGGLGDRPMFVHYCMNCGDSYEKYSSSLNKPCKICGSDNVHCHEDYHITPNTKEILSMLRSNYLQQN